MGGGGAGSSLHCCPRWSSRGRRGVPARCTSCTSKGVFDGALDDFSSRDLRKLVAVVGSSLTHRRCDSALHGLDWELFWESLRVPVVPAGRLRPLVVDEAGVSESEVEPLGQLAGSLEELELNAEFLDDPEDFEGVLPGLPRFPESICDLT